MEFSEQLPILKYLHLLENKKFISNQFYQFLSEHLIEELVLYEH